MLETAGYGFLRASAGRDMVRAKNAATAASTTFLSRNPIIIDFHLVCDMQAEQQPVLSLLRRRRRCPFRFAAAKTPSTFWEDGLVGRPRREANVGLPQAARSSHARLWDPAAPHCRRPEQMRGKAHQAAPGRHRCDRPGSPGIGARSEPSRDPRPPGEADWGCGPRATLAAVWRRAFLLTSGVRGDAAS